MDNRRLILQQLIKFRLNIAHIRGPNRNQPQVWQDKIVVCLKLNDAYPNEIYNNKRNICN